MTSLKASHWVALAGVLMSACVMGKTLRKESVDIQERLVAVREAGAYSCAPTALARAETHTDFFVAELDRGDSLQAIRHRDIARKALKKVYAKAKTCRPPPKEEPVRAQTDRDGDGVADEHDACPEAPGPVEYLGCPDRDEDGIPDHADQCPQAPEDFDNSQDDDGCPEEEDGDGDGVMDEADVCPDVAGPPDNQGCPYADRDGDGILDDDDECPIDPEDADEYQDEDGCPDLDNDGDGMPDATDTCPKLPETRNGYQDDDGCPDINPGLVVVNREVGKIEIKQKVYFASGKASIKPRSYALLNEVAEVLKANPSMYILVEGHTDSKGSDSYNMRLSQKRANAVREYLVAYGVEPERLEAMGFGEVRPIDDNSTRDGRERNRRVEFTITKE